MTRTPHPIRPAAFLVLLLTASLLAACSSGTEDFSRQIGLVRDAPDEFTVTTRAPLSMPPDLTLPAPQPGATRPQERTPRQAAEAALVPGSALVAAQQGGAASPGQQALVKAAGPVAPAGIRDEINKEAAVDSGSRSLTDRLEFWKPSAPKGVVVDPEKEAQRLRSNAALGQPVDTGDTPIIQRENKSLLDSLF